MSRIEVIESKIKELNSKLRTIEGIDRSEHCKNTLIRELQTTHPDFLRFRTKLIKRINRKNALEQHLIENYL